MANTSRVILNGKGAANDAVRAAVGALRKRGHSIGVRVTWEGGDAARLAREALREGVDRLVGPEGTEEGAVIVLAVGNGCQAGGRVPITPAAELDDGLLDLILVRDFPAAEFGRVLAELQDLRNPDNRFVYYLQLAAFRLEGDRELPINLDGEPYHWKEIDFQCLPGALRAVLPRACPLVSTAQS